MTRLKRYTDKRALRAGLFFMYALGCAFLLGLALYLFLTFYPFKTVEIYNTPVPVLNDVPVRTGEAVFYETHFCKFTSAPALSTRTLEGADPKNNKLVVTSSAQGGTAPKSQYGDVKYRVNPDGEKVFDFPCDKDNPQIRQSGGFVVPNNVPAGTYRLRIVSRYQVNPIRNIPYQFTTQEFVIEDGAARNPAPTPKSLSITPPKTVVVQVPSDGEVILEPVSEPTNNVQVHAPLVPVNAEVKVKAPKVTIDNPKKICLPIVGCVKL